VQFPALSPVAARAARGALVAIALLSVVPSPGLAAEAPLTLAEAQRLAVARSRQLVAQDAAVTAAREMAVAAGQLPDPVATVGINNMPVNGPDAFTLTRDFMTMTSVGVMQEFTRREKREARAERFEREADKSLAERSASIAAIRRATAIAWLDRYYADATQAVIAAQSREAMVEVEAAEGAYRAGRGNLADILAAKSALSMLDDRASEARRKTQVARIALARWIGPAADAPLSGTPAIDAIGLDPRQLDTELPHHPELAVLARKEQMAAADVRLAQAARDADWSVALMYNQRGSAYSNMVSINVSIPLQWDRKDRQNRELAAKLALLDQARAERDDMLQSHDAEVRAMIAEWDSDRERSARYRRELLPLAFERTQATLAAYRGAKASLTDVLAAYRSEIEVRMQALQLEMDTARLWAQLSFLAADDDGHSSPASNKGTR